MMTYDRRTFFKTLLTAVAPTPPADPIHHLLQRISYGPRPDEIARAQQMGIPAYLEEQLNPQSIPDSDCDARLARLPILFMDRHTAHRLSDSQYRTYKALVQGFVTRAAHSRRQLLERVVEFWADHFNVVTDDADLLIYQREAIRQHALGTFGELLTATAKSPAMLVYLDNYVNVAAHPNENYARELLELHTLGVDGGYTEQDVKEVARAFTGWTIHNGVRSGFYFNPAEHDDGAKAALGHHLPGGRGIEDGLHVLQIVANHPATAVFVSRKLATRFVSDDPPPSLVNGMARVWQQTGGDIRAILRHLFLSPEFQASVGQKLRRPLDFFIGTLRATGSEISDWWQLEQMLHALGQPPYGWHPPDGYPDTAVAWLSTSGLLTRWNLAMQLTHAAHEDPQGWGWGLRANLHEHIGSPQTVGELVDEVAAQVFGMPLGGEGRDAFIAYAADGGGANTPLTTRRRGRKLGSLFGLMLASPYFQWR